MLFDLWIPFLMLWKPIRNWVFFSAILFHTNNYFVFPIGIFPVLALFLTLIYFDADFPRKIVPVKIKKWFSQQYRNRLLRHDNLSSEKSKLYSSQQIPRIMLLFLGFYVLAHLILPFRHLQYPGRTTWHEEGHYFAWRMMPVSYTHLTLPTKA